MANVKITETFLRGANQALLGSRMPAEDMASVLEALDAAGFHSVEVWGGASFDACVRVLDEDPWLRLRAFKKRIRKTPMQMLLGGQNMLGLRHFADDVVEYFIKKMAEYGIGIIRAFDALGDIRNLETVIKAAKDEGVHLQAAMAYSVSPAHSTKFFAGYAKALEGAGADSICIMDPAGLLAPYSAYEIVRAIKEETRLPVQLCTHYGAGFGSMSCLKAAEAGADAIDTAISPFAQGASLPPTESMVAALEGTPYDTKLNPAKLGPIRAAALKLREKYTENGILATELLGVDITTLLHQAPGAVISGLRGELEELGKLHLLDKVMREIPNVRKDCGDPPMSAPIGQIIATQSALNVIKSGRYKMITREFRGLIRGEYGETPSPVDPEFRKSIIGEDEIIDCRPADLIPPEMEKLRGGLPEMYNERDVDILTFSQFPASALKFFERRSNRKYGVDGKYSDKKTKVHPV